MSRPRPAGTSQPPSKRARLAHDAPNAALEALVNGSLGGKPQFTAKTNGVHPVRKDRPDESRAVVAVGDSSGRRDVAMKEADQDVIDISSGVEESDSDDEDEDEDEDEGEDNDNDSGTGARAQEEPAEDDAPAPHLGDNGAAEPVEERTFGEIMDEIDVKIYSDPHARSDRVTKLSATAHLSTPTATSLGTVLTQALKTNDQQLFESCFSLNDLNSVRATVERLPSNLAASLLQRLAERLHKRPGRAGPLMVWVQWTIISHGAYLAGQPEVVKQLTALNRVLKQRANGLQPLLSLKGRLDMLKAQLTLREEIQQRAVKDDEDDEPIIYVESKQDENEATEKPAASRKGISTVNFDDSESSGDEMPTTANGISDAEDSEADSQDSEDLIDDEAEETDADTGDDLSGSELESDIELDDANDISESEEESDSIRPSMGRNIKRRN